MSDEIGMCIFVNFPDTESASPLDHDIHGFIGVGLYAEDPASGSNEVWVGNATDFGARFDEADSKSGFVSHAVSDQFDITGLKNMNRHSSMGEQHCVEWK